METSVWSSAVYHVDFRWLNLLSRVVWRYAVFPMGILIAATLSNKAYTSMEIRDEDVVRMVFHFNCLETGFVNIDLMIRISETVFGHGDNYIGNQIASSSQKI